MLDRILDELVNIVAILGILLGVGILASVLVVTAYDVINKEKTDIICTVAQGVAK